MDFRLLGAIARIQCERRGKRLRFVRIATPRTVGLLPLPMFAAHVRMGWIAIQRTGCFAGFTLGRRSTDRRTLCHERARFGSTANNKDVITLPIEAAEVRIEEGGVLAFYGARTPGEREQLIQAFIPGRYLEVIDSRLKERLNGQSPPDLSPRGAAIMRSHGPRRQLWND